MSKINDLAESTIGKIAARWITPAAIGFLVYFVQGIDSGVNEMERAQWKLFGEVENLRGVTQERLDNINRRLTNNENKLERHDSYFTEIWRSRNNINDMR